MGASYRSFRATLGRQARCGRAGGRSRAHGGGRTWEEGGAGRRGASRLWNDRRPCTPRLPAHGRAPNACRVLSARQMRSPGSLSSPGNQMQIVPIAPMTFVKRRKGPWVLTGRRRASGGWGGWEGEPRLQVWSEAGAGELTMPLAVLLPGSSCPVKQGITWNDTAIGTRARELSSWRLGLCSEWGGGSGQGSRGRNPTPQASRLLTWGVPSLLCQALEAHRSWSHRKGQGPGLPRPLLGQFQVTGEF